MSAKSSTRRSSFPLECLGNEPLAMMNIVRYNSQIWSSSNLIAHMPSAVRLRKLLVSEVMLRIAAEHCGAASHDFLQQETKAGSEETRSACQQLDWPAIQVFDPRHGRVLEAGFVGASAFLKGMEAFKLASRHRSSLSALSLRQIVASTCRRHMFPLDKLACAHSSASGSRWQWLGCVNNVCGTSAGTEDSRRSSSPCFGANQLSLGPKRVIAPAAPTLPEHEPPRCMSAYERWV